MKQFIVHWATVRDGYMIRGGYTVVYGFDKRDARKALRSNLFIDRGEKIRIGRVESV